MHDNFDFNVQINDDAIVNDKQQLIADKNYNINDSTTINIPESNQKSKSNSILDMGAPQSEIRGQDSLPISSSAYDLSKSGHPIACIFTFLFKALSLIVYFLFQYKFDNNIFIFVLVIVFNALDFWTTKNITGRLLVGMRWWNIQNEKGEEVYQYETKGQKFVPNQVDYAFFWSSQLVSFIFWVLVALFHILTPFWLILDLLTIGMLFTNIYGFYRCKSEHQQKVQDVQDKLKVKGFSFLANYIMKK
ncbi:FAM18-like protein (macronuclear) [Tetrahymena thermophila SB210]|uniref:Golgi apparatus membrane protein TVP23 homolog n=1 Tax=Tetrahymena thermophila (strain SB210) TaxID=312017 RepID=I7MFI0_TETTS|nr:FAM18-like protein [Tetrahymena thermophila SB210]EAR83963.2 FAM18-like protein [Tetrahymena thermophila SB210]|eukprot:XP_001031626.2 FAM18-like protein [Tetrahymena thermophila SB210]